MTHLITIAGLGGIQKRQTFSHVAVSGDGWQSLAAAVAMS